MIEVSVVIPAFNEENNIERCLISLEGQDFDRTRYEIIVVDNGSKDRTASVASRFDAKLIERPRCLIGAVRNHGVTVASGRIIAFLDADCEAPSEWLKNGVREFKKNKNLGCVGGTCLSPVTGTLFERLWAPCVKSNQRISYSVRHMATGTCFIRKSIIEEVGGFSESQSTGEDTDLTSRIRRYGYVLLYSNSCDVIHYGYPKNSVTFLKRQYNQGLNHLRSFHGLRDFTFFSVILFCFSMLALVLFALSGSPYFWYPALFCFFIVGIFSVYRGYVKRSDLNVYYYAGCFYINFLYFIGRGLGVCVSIFRLIYN